MKRGIIFDIVTILLTNKRHKAYEAELQQASIHRVPAPVLGTPIKSQNDRDYSGSFERW